MDTGDIVVIEIIGAFLIFCFGVYIGANTEDIISKNKLVKSGHAEYYLDKNNNRQWRMKPCPKRKLK